MRSCSRRLLRSPPVPEIDLYGKQGCKLCKAAAEKLELLGFDFKKHEVAGYLDHHEGWKDDGSVEVSSAYYMHDQKLPIIRIGHEFYTYAGAMRKLRRDTKT